MIQNIHAYICMHPYMYISVCIYVYVAFSWYVCEREYVRISMYVNPYANTHTHTHTHTHIHKCKYICVYTDAYLYKCRSIYTYVNNHSGASEQRSYMTIAPVKHILHAWLLIIVPRSLNLLFSWPIAHEMSDLAVQSAWMHLKWESRTSSIISMHYLTRLVSLWKTKCNTKLDTFREDVGTYIYK